MKTFLQSNMGQVVIVVFIFLCIFMALRLNEGAKKRQASAVRPQPKRFIMDAKPAPEPAQRSAYVPGTRMPKRPGADMSAPPIWGLPREMQEEEQEGPIEEEEQEYEPEPPPSMPGVEAFMPEIPKQVGAKQRKRLAKPSGTRHGASSSGGAAGASLPAFKSFDDREKEQTEQRHEALRAAQPPGPPPAQNLTPEQRKKLSVQRAFSEGTPIQKIEGQKNLMYQLEKVGKQVQERSLETGAPNMLTPAETDALIRELGIQRGGQDEKPNPNSVGTVY